MDDLNLGGVTNQIDDDALGNANDVADPLKMEQFTQPLDSFELERTMKVGKCNMRKSLAWDSAFFTSAGVLDPDELSSMMGGDGNGKRQFLPGIEEDIYRSTDSISTLGSENLTLESLDIDLFQDIRASIQKSSQAPNKANASRAASGDKETKAIFSLEEKVSSNNMVKPKAGPKKLINPKQAPAKLNLQNIGSTQSTQPIVRNGAPSPTLQKATKAIARPMSVPSAVAGRSSIRSNQVKMENDKAKNASAHVKVVPVPKIPVSSGLKKTMPKPVSSLKSSSSSSTATKKEPPKLSSSSDSSISISSVKADESPAGSNRRKSAYRSIKPTSSTSSLKVPSKVAMKKRGESVSSTSLNPSRLSSSLSPASSISEWSLDSSSSTSSVNQSFSTLRASIGTGSPRITRNADAPPNISRRINDRNLERHENKVTRPPSEKVNTASTQRVPPPKPSSAKPSGLRMPSPKIGFFDGVKAVQTPDGSLLSHSGVPVSPKFGPGVSTLSGISSKAKPPKLQPTRLLKPVGNSKLDIQKPASPLPLKKLSNALAKVHSSPMGVRTPVPLGSNKKADSEAEETRYEECNEANVVQGNSLDAEKTRSVEVNGEMNLDGCSGANLANVKIVPVQEDINDCKEENVCEGRTDNGKSESQSINLADVKCEIKLHESSITNSVNVKIAPLERNGDDCEGKMICGEKCDDGKYDTENMSLVQVKSQLNFAEESNPKLVNEKTTRVDGQINDSERKLVCEEKSDTDVSLFDNKSERNLVEESNGYSVSLQIAPLDVDMNVNVGKMEFFGGRGDDVISDKTGLAHMECEMDAEGIAYSADMKIAPVNKDINDYEGENVSEEKINNVKSDAEEISQADLNCEMSMDEKSSANLVDVKIATVDGHINKSEEENASLQRSDNIKSEMQCLVNNVDSSHESNEKENQAIGAGYLEHDLQKGLVSKSTCNPQDFGQKEEPLSNFSQVNQISETIASERTPFNDKNSPCNNEGYPYHISTELSTMEKTTFLPSFECTLTEN